MIFLTTLLSWLIGALLGIFSGLANLLFIPLAICIMYVLGTFGLWLWRMGVNFFTAKNVSM